MNTRSFYIALATIFAAGSLGACQAAAPAPAPAPAPASAPAATPQPAPRVVDVAAVDYAFQAPAVIPSGWTTLRFRNDGEEHHMVFMSRLPAGKTLEDYETEISAPYARAWNAVRNDGATQQEALGMIIQAMPTWFSELRFVGGPGLAAPGVTSEVTLNLEPGYYALECYVKTADGEIHLMEGMLRPLVVSEQRAAAPPPASDIRVTLSNFEMAVEGNLTPGHHTVAVHVAENPEVGLGHSVHVARLNPGTAAQEVVEWMNWLTLDGYREPAPARFVGGVHPMPTGSTAYFTVYLEPGRYLLVSEATGAQGVQREVTVR